MLTKPSQRTAATWSFVPPYLHTRTQLQRHIIRYCILRIVVRLPDWLAGYAGLDRTYRHTGWRTDITSAQAGIIIKSNFVSFKYDLYAEGVCPFFPKTFTQSEKKSSLQSIAAPSAR